MKQKIISIILILIAILAPLLITPIIIKDSSYYYKNIAVLTGGACLAVMLLLNIKEFKIDKKDILIFIFMGLVIISTCLSSNIKTSIWGQRTRHEGMLMLLSYCLIYFSTKKFLKIENKKDILNILFYAYLIIGIIGILQRHIAINRLYPIFGRKIAATFGNANFFGNFITIVLPVLIYIFLFKGSKKAFTLSLIMFFNMLSCHTRSAWGAFIIYFILIIVYLIKNRNKKFFLRFAILFISFALIFVYMFYGLNFVKEIRKKSNQDIKVIPTTSVQTKITRTEKEIKKAVETNSLDRIMSGRGKIWRWTLVVISKKPIFGCGPDNLYKGIKTYCKEEVEQDEAKYRNKTDKAHNEYLQIAATIGIPALITYLTFLSLIIFPKLKNMFKKQAIFILLITIIGYLAQAFFNISTIGVAPLFWMLLGLIDNKEVLEVLNTND